MLPCSKSQRKVHWFSLSRLPGDDGWRMTFMAPNMPFYIVELAEFLHKDDKAGRAAWDYMREQQAKAAKENANAVLIKNKDLGEWNDIHPLDKKTLGKRAAKAAIDDLKKNN